MSHQLQYAGFWNRFAALFIDALVLVIPQALFGILFSMAFVSSANSVDPYFGYAIMSKLIALLIAWLYFALLESSKYRATIGKLALGIMVTDLAGNRITFGRASGRFFGKLLSSVIAGFGYLMAAFTDKKQTLHDILADCLVIKKPTLALSATSSIGIERQSVNSAAVPVKETKLPAHEPMLTSQPTEESPEPAVNCSNACPACGAENPPDVKFCESCSGEFYRACPECGRESSVKSQYCGGCGTDMDGFLAASKILMRMEACKEEKNLLQIIEANKGLKGDVRLPGRKGKKLHAGIEELARKADNILKQIERLEKEIELRCPVGAKPSISDDRKLLKRLDEHYWIQPYFSEKLRVLEKKTKARVSEAARIVRRRNFKIIAGFVVLVVLGLNRDILLFWVRKSAFQKAVETRQQEAAQSVAKKLDGWYDTDDGLKALEEFEAAKDRFNDEVGGAGELLQKFSSVEWLAVQELAGKAEEPGDPREGAALYGQARTRLQAMPSQFSDMISSKRVYDELSNNKLCASEVHLQKYAPQEWAAARQMAQNAATAATPEGVAMTYRQAETLLRASVEKVKTVPATVVIECNMLDFEIFENNQQKPVVNGHLSLLPFIEHSLEIRKKGYESQMLMVKADEPGQDMGVRRIDLLKTIAADLVAVVDAAYAPLSGLVEGSAQAQEAQQAAVKQTGLPLEVKSRVTGIPFRLIPAGSFTMGESYSRHPVMISQPFYCGKFEVTQRDWERVMGSNPAYFKNVGNTAPVEQVSWSDCQVFLKKLCDMEGVPQGSYRLLTEAEWEYACRAGTTAACAAGDWSTLDTMGWYNGSSSHPVGLKMANAWGLYDMHGNVSELCDDWYGDYPSVSVTDPKGPSSGILRVDRGESWKSHGLFGGQADRRSSSSPNALNYDLGFRLLRISPQVEQKPKKMRFSDDNGLAYK